MKINLKMGCLKMHRPFNGFEAAFISTYNSKLINYCRNSHKMRISFYLMPLNYEQNEPLDVPMYAIGQGIMRLNRIILRFVRSALFLSIPGLWV